MPDSEMTRTLQTVGSNSAYGSSTGLAGMPYSTPGRPSTSSLSVIRSGPDDLGFLEEAVQGNFLFACLAPEQRRAVLGLFERRPVRAGDVVIRQGEAGDMFYIVEQGAFDVFLLQQPSGSTPEHVHTYTSQPGMIASFGELALLYSKQRAAMVVARTEGSLWALHRQPFRAALQAFEVAQGSGLARLTEPQLRGIVRILRSVEVLQCLTTSQLFRLACTLSQVTYKDGEYIIRQGEEGRDFFLIQSGEVVCTVRGGLTY